MEAGRAIDHEDETMPYLRDSRCRESLLGRTIHRWSRGNQLFVRVRHPKRFIYIFRRIRCSDSLEGPWEWAAGRIWGVYDLQNLPTIGCHPNPPALQPSWMGASDRIKADTGLGDANCAARRLLQCFRPRHTKSSESNTISP